VVNKPEISFLGPVHTVEFQSKLFIHEHGTVLYCIPADKRTEFWDVVCVCGWAVLTFSKTRPPPRTCL